MKSNAGRVLAMKRRREYPMTVYPPGYNGDPDWWVEFREDAPHYDFQNRWLRSTRWSAMAAEISSKLVL